MLLGGENGRDWGPFPNGWLLWNMSPWSGSFGTGGGGAWFFAGTTKCTIRHEPYVQIEMWRTCRSSLDTLFKLVNEAVAILPRLGVHNDGLFS